MKTRIGFVSNSSSSSFVVAATPGQTKIKITFEIDLDDYADHTISTPEELDDYYQKNYSWELKDPNSEISKEKMLYLEKLSQGKIILIGHFSDDHDGVERLLCDEGIKNFSEQNSHLDIIYGDGGY